MSDEAQKELAAEYAKLAKPHENEERARVAANAFMAEVGALRAKYRIPEVVLYFSLVMADETGEEQNQRMTGGCGWGNQLYQAQLAKDAADREFESLAVIVANLAASMPSVRKSLITDPTKR